MPSLEEQIVIHASAERIFELLARPERGPEWTPNLLRVEVLEGTRGPDTRTRLVARVGALESQGTGRCVEWDPPRHLALESTLDLGVTSTTRFLLAERGDATQVLARVEYSLPSKGLARFMGGLLGEPLARRDLRKALTNLKQLVEREGA